MQSFALNVPQEKILHDLALLLLQARGIPQDERELIVAYNDAVAGLIDEYNNRSRSLLAWPIGRASSLFYRVMSATVWVRAVLLAFFSISVWTDSSTFQASFSGSGPPSGLCSTASTSWASTP